MNTVTFTNKNSYADFGLILNHKEIGSPDPRTNYIDVPARDGHLDLTEAFGEVKYKTRKIVFAFSYIGSDANWAATLSALQNYIHGQKHKIYFEEEYYYRILDLLAPRCFPSRTHWDPRKWCLHRVTNEESKSLPQAPPPLQKEWASTAQSSPPTLFQCSPQLKKNSASRASLAASSKKYKPQPPVPCLPAFYISALS